MNDTHWHEQYPLARADARASGWWAAGGDNGNGASIRLCHYITASNNKFQKSNSIYITFSFTILKICSA